MVNKRLIFAFMCRNGAAGAVFCTGAFGVC
jgi:hypothetical protein